MKDISYIAAFPKSGITYLNFMLFNVLFDCPQNAHLIDSDYIFDIHESLARVPPPDDVQRYVKIHAAYGPTIPLLNRAARAVCMVRDPIDVMMSVWDFMHLTGDRTLLNATPAESAAKFNQFCRHWITTGGQVFPWANSWVNNVNSWLDQTQLPKIFVRYETLRQKPFEEMTRVLDFLGRQATPERIAAAVEAGKAENMKKIEANEIANRITGVFYRPSMAQGYAKGYRFVGQQHTGSSEKVLSPEAKQFANDVFQPIMARVLALAV